MAVRSRGVRSASALLEDIERGSRDAGRIAANRAADRVKTEASRRTRAVYNIKKKDLDRYIQVSKVGRNQTAGTASVKLEVRPIPLRQFGARVRMRTIEGVDSLGRAIGRKPTITVKLFKSGSRQWIRPAFPLHQRFTGPLQGGDAIRRRIGSARDRLTPLRFLTFPDSFRQKLVPALNKFAGDRVAVEFRAAWRKRFRGQRRLRGPGS